jgi:predicted lipid-binding transport protein (Tim44 family)
MPDSQTLGLIIAATVAAVLLFRLYTVLGRRTGHEPPPPETRSVLAAPEPQAVALGVADPLARGLMEVQLADRGFDKAHFLKGARTAYELVQKAFAAGDRTALKPLLSDDVYAAFDGAIAARSGPAPESLGGITDARISAADLHGDTAEITVSFRAQFVDGSAGAGGQRDVSDVWTFARRIGAADPNWTLIATSGDAA